MRRALRAVIAVTGFALLLGGCATLQTGRGELSAGARSVALTWTSRDGITGTMSVTLPDGVAYTGPFFQITSVERRELFAPPWVYGWYGAEPWPATEYATRYSGKVVANLRSKQGAQMHCRLRLAQPARGMAGGGDGSCRSAAGERFHAFFPPLGTRH